MILIHLKKILLLIFIFLISFKICQAEKNAIADIKITGGKFDKSYIPDFNLIAGSNNPKEISSTGYYDSSDINIDHNKHINIVFDEIPIKDCKNNDDDYVLIIGKLKSEKEELFLPLTTFNSEEFERCERLEKKLKVFQNIRVAFENSFPFLAQSDTSFINEKNISKVLFSIKLLIERGYVSDKDSWNRIYSFFHHNESFFTKGGSYYVGLILEYLQTFYTLSQKESLENSDFVSFYIRFLINIESLDIGGINLNNNTKLEKHIFEEFKKIITSNANKILPLVQHILSVYKNNRENYCIDISILFFDKLIRDGNLLLSLKEDYSNQKDVFSAIITSTECVQNIYIKNNMEEGTNKGNIIGGGRYLISLPNGRNFIDKFIDLFSELERIDIVSNNKYRQVREIKKYYNIYYDLSVIK